MDLALKPEHAARKTGLAKLLPATNAENLPTSRESGGEGGKKKQDAKKQQGAAQ